MRGDNRQDKKEKEHAGKVTDNVDTEQHEEGEENPPYAQYQLTLYERGIAAGELPVTTCDTGDDGGGRGKLEAQAKEKMNPNAFNYVKGGAGEQLTVVNNRMAFRGWGIVPRFLRPTDGPIIIKDSNSNRKNDEEEKNKGGGGRIKRGRDLRVKLFGTKYATPVVVAPVGVQGIFHEDGETGVARACAELDIPFTLSTASTTSIEDIAREMDDAVARSREEKGTSEGVGEGASDAPSKLKRTGNEEKEEKVRQPMAPRWFQLYWPLSEELTRSILFRAQREGYTVLVVTLDTFTMSWRPLDLDTAHLPFVTGIGNAVGFSDPVFRSMFRRAHPAGEKVEVEDAILSASRLWISQAFSGHAHRWEDLKILRDAWKGPIVLKGVLSPLDAELAVSSGYVDGIIVSNHGGRQLDGSVASLDVLPDIVRAVGNRTTVIFDSGVRTGADVIKALALGAKGVMIGRPVMYGLGIAGEKGAKHVLAGILADLDQSMGLSGVKSIDEIDRGMIRRIRWAGDYRSEL